MLFALWTGKSSRNAAPTVTIYRLLCHTIKETMIGEQEYNSAVTAYTRNIFRFIQKSLKDKEATEDLVQDCFLKLWQNRSNIDNSKIKSWLFATAHNAMINYIKLQSRKISIDQTDVLNLAVESKGNFDIKELLERSLNELPPLQKSIVLLRDLEGYNYAEIGNILQLNESQVKVYLFRARKKIKDSLKTLSNVL
jgi:RNA polymerase sigma-70 factor, ECF subfamily